MNTSDFKILEFGTNKLVNANILLERLKRKSGLNTTQWHQRAQEIAGASIGSRSTLAEVLGGSSSRKLPLKSIPYLIEALGLEPTLNDYYVGAFLRVFLPKSCRKYVSTTKAQEQIDVLKKENISLVRSLSNFESYRLLSEIGGAEKVVELEKEYGIKRDNFDLPVSSGYENFRNEPDFGPFEEIAIHAEKEHSLKRLDWINFVIQVIETGDIEFQQFVSCLLPKQFEDVFDYLFVPVNDYYQAYYVDTPIRAYTFASWIYHYSIEEIKLDALLSIYAEHHIESFTKMFNIYQKTCEPNHFDKLSDEEKLLDRRERRQKKISDYKTVSTPFKLFLESNLKRIRSISVDIFNQISPYGVETHIQFKIGEEFALKRFASFHSKQNPISSYKEQSTNFRIARTEHFPNLMERQYGLLKLLHFMLLRDIIRIQGRITSIVEWENKTNTKERKKMRKKFNFLVDHKQTLSGLLSGARRYFEMD